MGVPSFYRWLVNKYPKIVTDAGGGGAAGNALEFDNLYLDMNGIIHPCFHPDDNHFPPTTFGEVFESMHKYIDHLVEIVKPQKLLFMAIDGVAPRAKMNQQRARRFRTAKDSEIAEKLEEQVRKQFELEGKVVLPKVDSELSDSNIITPGTEFMHKLSQNLRSYINQRINENPLWGNIEVILSDDKAPGEGEHKIMSFIRSQRSSPEYDPNTSHCLYGLDADLIMLALATHEVHFSILREEVLPPNSGPINRTMNSSINSRGWFKEKPWQPSSGKSIIHTAKDHFRVSKRKAYQFLNVSVLREYLALDMEIPSFDKFEFDLERIIDDFIFICFFAGNDFLPQMPSLEIHEGCIDLLMDIYKKEFQNLGGYLVNTEKVDDKKGSYIKLSRVGRFILAVGAYEERIFSRRTQIRDRKLSRILAEYRDAKEEEQNNLEEEASSEIMGMHNIRFDELSISAPAVDADQVLENTKELHQKVKEKIRSESDLLKDGSFGTDKVKFGIPGWRERYYKEKFRAEDAKEMEEKRKSSVEKYVEGLCWVLQYYFSGVPSWSWYYSYHYGPFASDFKGISQLKVRFQKGSPFNPFDQLMAVLPPMSSQALPLAYRRLMVDEDSKIIDFFPTEFEVDVDGKRFLWQGICKLPFIDEDRLLMETRKIENQLKDEEKIRNEPTHPQLFLRRSNTFRKYLQSCRETKNTFRKYLQSCRETKNSELIKGAIEIESEIRGIKGTIHLMREALTVTDDHNSTEDICMYYEIPQCFQYIPRPLEGINFPEKTVKRDDLEATVLWHEHHRNGTERNNYMHRSYQKPDTVLKGTGNGKGFSSGRGRASLPQQNQNHNGDGFLPQKNQNHNSVGLFKPPYRRQDYGRNEGFQTSGTHHRGKSSYRPYDGNYWQPRGGESEDRREHKSYAPNGGRGQGRGRGWYVKKS